MRNRIEKYVEERNNIKIRHIRPFSTSKNIGQEYNQTISELPEDCYVCLTDGDVLFLTPDWGCKIEAIIKDNLHYDVITCMTNRIGLKGCLIDELELVGSISNHIERASMCWNEHNTKVKEYDVAPGMLMIFPKWVWQNNPFKENSIYFDREFSKSVIANGGKIGVALGLYVFHLYRWGQRIPQLYTEHLR